MSGIPFMRYSTALSGLLKAARRAFTTSSFPNPMSHSCFTVFSYSEPVTRVEVVVPPCCGVVVVAVGFASVGFEAVVTGEEDDGAEVEVGPGVDVTVEEIEVAGALAGVVVEVGCTGVVVVLAGAGVVAAGFLTIKTRKSLSEML